MTDQRKTYVLDTSVLLSAPNALLQFVEHRVVIPLAVVEELEEKRTHALLGYQAREALRAINALRAHGRLDEDITVNDQGGTVRVEMNHIDQSGLPESFSTIRNNDSRILAVAFNFKGEGDDVTVVSKDLPMRLKAEILGLNADEYRSEMVVVTTPYTGVIEHEVAKDVIDALYEQGDLDIAMADIDACTIDHAEHADDDIEKGGVLESAHPNTGVILIGPGSASALARVTPDKRISLIRSDPAAFGVTGRSAEQRIALANLLDPNIGVVSLGGLAGSGKSFLALAAGLEQVMESRTYKKVFVFRPLYAVGGQDLGYLPGSADEKMGPWGAAVFDALGSMVGKPVVDEILARDMLEVLPLTHLRGRTLSDAYVIVDEAQNLERPVLLTALTRLGENSKIVLSWDAAQRDNTRVGRHDGIAAIVERLKGEPLFAHTTFSKSERGPVAAMATRLLDDMVG